MLIRTFLDVSTAHLSPEARRWLSESATLNHAANYHGIGHGAALGTIAATLTGWFMNAPAPLEDGGLDHGIPDDLAPLISKARNRGAEFMLIEADGPIHHDLPIYDDETGED